jgi:hypothetical protein
LRHKGPKENEQQEIVNVTQQGYDVTCENCSKKNATMLEVASNQITLIGKSGPKGLGLGSLKLHLM